MVRDCLCEKGNLCSLCGLCAGIVAQQWTKVLGIVSIVGAFSAGDHHRGRHCQELCEMPAATLQ